MKPFHSTVALDFACLRPLRRSLRTWLEALGVADPELSGVLLATHEAAANAIEHAGSIGPLEIEARFGDGVLTVDISDTGSWSAAALTPGDRRGGLALIVGLVQRIEIDSGAGGTTVRLLQRAGLGGHPAVFNHS